MTDITLESLAEQVSKLSESLTQTAETMKSFQRLSDGLKKEIKSLKQPGTQTVSSEEDALPDNSKVADPEVAKQLKHLRDQNEKLLKRDEERAARERDRNFTDTVSKSLLAAGFDPKYIEDATILAKHKGVAKMDEEGNVVFTIDGDDYTDPSAGAKQFAKTASAKLFLPPKGNKGSGNKEPNHRGESPDKEGKYSDQQIEAMAQDLFFGTAQ